MSCAFSLPRSERDRKMRRRHKTFEISDELVGQDAVETRRSVSAPSPSASASSGGANRSASHLRQSAAWPGLRTCRKGARLRLLAAAAIVPVGLLVVLGRPAGDAGNPATAPGGPAVSSLAVPGSRRLIERQRRSDRSSRPRRDRRRVSPSPPASRPVPPARPAPRARVGTGPVAVAAPPIAPVANQPLRPLPPPRVNDADAAAEEFGFER